MLQFTRLSALACAMAAIGLLYLQQPAEAATATYRCMNTTSGTTWDVKVDYDLATVDSFPAKISADKISWKDTKTGGHYSLDRKSGDMVFSLANSVGGSLWFHKCQPA